MNRTYRALMVVAVFAGLAAAGWVSAYAANALQAAPTAIAVVDMSKVFNASEEKREIDAQTNRRINETEERRASDVEALRAMQEQLSLINVNETAQLLAQREEIERRAISMNVEYEFRKRQVAREGIMRLENLYRKVLSTTEQVAQGRGYDIVLFKETPEIPNAENIEQLLNRVASRKVLWASDKADITDEVSTRLNNTFVNRAQ